MLGFTSEGDECIDFGNSRERAARGSIGPLINNQRNVGYKHPVQDRARH